MKYKLEVSIVNPEDANNVKDLAFDVSFYCNGYGVVITRDEGEYFELSYDLRYDKDFHKDKKEEWIMNWANNYWTGENGSFKLQKITIARV